MKISNSWYLWDNYSDWYVQKPNENEKEKKNQNEWWIVEIDKEEKEQNKHMEMLINQAENKCFTTTIHVISHWLKSKLPKCQ